MCLQPRRLPLQSHTCYIPSSYIGHGRAKSYICNISFLSIVCLHIFFSMGALASEVCSSLWKMFSLIKQNKTKQNQRALLCNTCMHVFFFALNCYISMYVCLSYIFELHVGLYYIFFACMYIFLTSLNCTLCYIPTHHTSAHTCFITPDTLTQLNQTHTFAMKLNFITMYVHSRSLHCNAETNSAKRSKFQMKSLGFNHIHQTQTTPI